MKNTYETMSGNACKQLTEMAWHPFVLPIDVFNLILLSVAFIDGVDLLGALYYTQNMPVWEHYKACTIAINLLASSTCTAAHAHRRGSRIPAGMDLPHIY